jgi:hypothetical protein
MRPVCAAAANSPITSTNDADLAAAVITALRG